MEKAKGVLMAEGDFGWSDVGSWASLAEIWPKDSSGNALRGEALFLDSRNCLVYSPHRQSAVVGLEDVIIIDTKDALLVCSQKADQRVKEVIEALKKKGRKRSLTSAPHGFSDIQYLQTPGRHFRPRIRTREMLSLSSVPDKIHGLAGDQKRNFRELACARGIRPSG